MKTITFRTVLVVLVALFSLNANAYDVYIDGIYYNVITKANYAEVTYGEKECGTYSGDIVIPSSIKYEGVVYPVTKIGDKAFWEGTGDKITSIKLPDCIKEIGTRAFSDCSITEIVIPDGVQRIGQSAFNGCDDLTKIDIPNSVTEIGISAFEFCRALQQVTLPDGLTEIGATLFGWCSSLKSIAIPNTVTKIESSAFTESGLTEIVIPNSVKRIYLFAFTGCGELKSVTIGSGLNVIDGKSFSNCPKIEDVYIYTKTPPSKASLGDISTVFEGSDIEYATLHVHGASLNAYKTTAPWSGFGKIESLMPMHTLTYMVDGETYKALEIEEGETITAEVEPTKDGYTFSGWSEIPATMPTYDVTVTGTFTKEVSILDKKYEDAMATIIDGNFYRISTKVGGTVYYLKENGTLTADKNEAKAFQFVAQEGGSTRLYEKGWNLGNRFTNPSMDGGGNGTFKNEGYIRSDARNDRDTWERQVFFKQGEEYAVRATNNTGTSWGANTFWNVIDAEAEPPFAGYSLEANYIWELTDVTQGGADVMAAKENLKVALDVANNTIDTKAGVGEGIFMIPESALNTYAEAVAAQQAVYDNAQATIEDVNAAIVALEEAANRLAASVQGPKAGAKYIFQSKQNDFFMIVNEDGVTIGEEGTKLSFENAGDGKYYVTADGEYYVGLAGTDKWTMTSVSDKKEPLTVSTTTVDGQVYCTFSESFGMVGVDWPYKDNMGCWADKRISDGDAVLWLVQEVGTTPKPVVPIASYKRNLSSQTTGTSSMIIGSYVRKSVGFNLVNKGTESIYVKELVVKNASNYAVVSRSTDTSLLGTLAGGNKIELSVNLTSDITTCYEWHYTYNGKDFVFCSDANDPAMKHDVTFYVDNNALVTYEYDQGDEIYVEEEPVKEGYTFSGWGTIPATMPNKDVAVKGTFTVNEYMLTYEVDGEAVKTSKVKYGKNITSNEKPQKEGYTFVASDEEPSTMPAHDVTIKGSFDINKYTLTYKLDGETYKTYEVEYGVSIKLEAEPSKEGYTFSGWSEIPATMPAKDVTVTGSFSKSEYQITYVVDGDTYKTIRMDFGNSITVEEAPEKEGYTFSGWSEIPATMPAKDLTVTGSFTINKYKLTYMLDGETYKIYELEYGANITPEPAPTKESYTFDGWSVILETMPAKDVTVTGSFTYIDAIEDVKVADGDYQIYTIDGKPVGTLQKGVNIIRYTNGKMKKVFVK